MSDERPIFIGGLAHSGKTQLRMVLGAHPDIVMTRRTYMWDRFYDRFGDLRRGRNLERCLSAMLGDEGVRRLVPDPARIRREFLEGPATYAHLFALFHRHHAERMGKRRWGEQLGFVERFADPIFAGFPSARMIHMIRDPRDRYGAGTTGPRRRGNVGWETARWLHSADLAERNRRRYPDTYRVVRYETLAAKPVLTVRELCAFLDEEYLPSMERVLTTIGFDLRADDASADFESAPRASTAELAFMDVHARSKLSAFGYPSMTTVLSSRDRLSFVLLNQPLNRATMAAWRIVVGRRGGGGGRE